MPLAAVPEEYSSLANGIVVALVARAVFASDVVMASVSEFFNLGFQKAYFSMYDKDRILEHVYGYICAKIAPSDTLSYAMEKDMYAFYFCDNTPSCQLATEGRMEVRYLAPLRKQEGKRRFGLSIRTFHSDPKDGAKETPNVVLYVLERSPFRLGEAPLKDDTPFEMLTTDRNLTSRPKEALARYKDLLVRLKQSFEPGVYVVAETDPGVLCLMIAFVPDRVSYFVSLSTLIQQLPNVQVTKKFLETFANGVQAYSFYLRGAEERELLAVAALVGQLPNRNFHSSLLQSFRTMQITPVASVYATAIVMFAFYFTPPARPDEFTELNRHLQHTEVMQRKLKKLRNEMFSELMSEGYISQILVKHLAIFNDLFSDFSNGTTAASARALEARINKEISEKTEADVFLTFLTFNRAVKKTNFFCARKAAIAFRLDPSVFMKELDFPRVPFAVFFVLGAHFRGFHVRFADISRGGIRLINTRGNTQAAREESYRKNKALLFHENYNLAYTQMLKNKDIPESGSKGTILVSTRSHASDKCLYLQYVDAMLDVLIPGVDGVKDTLGKEEILFFGPDEGTAGNFPSIAAHHARSRGYKHWKSLTTGKMPDIGGVPHDTYGMTTQSIRQYCLGIYRELGLEEEKLTKFMTGGPDGDLGSNEIKLGKERIVAICDGFASVHDPDGIDRNELLRLAQGRLSLKFFDKSKLTPRGFKVSVTDRNVKLPDGTIVEDGTAFRNTFHFTKYTDADIFVPCGGRPRSVSLSTVHLMLRNVSPSITSDRMLAERDLISDKSCLRFRFIVEGANLFVTQDARLALENVGFVLFKDSSTNKGGVTSSSLEVLAGLALTDEEHAKHMCVTDPKSIPAFYQALVDETCARLRENARREFSILWKNANEGHLEGKKTLISDRLSQRINDIKTYIQQSTLFEDKALFRFVLEQYVPKTIQNVVPIDLVMTRVPASYLIAIFAIYIASDFVYSTGLGANDFSFFQYMHGLQKRMAKHQLPPSKV